VILTYLWIYSRKYEINCELKVEERARFTTKLRRCFGWRVEIQYLDEYRWLPAFVDWLHDEVAKAGEGEDMPTRDVIEASKLLEKIAISYRAMYAHGMHLRIFTAEEEKVTCDSVVASVDFK
jgi:hypothetical protein